MLVIPMLDKKVQERRFGLYPFEKELLERRSIAFRHKILLYLHTSPHSITTQKTNTDIYSALKTSDLNTTILE